MRGIALATGSAAFEQRVRRAFTGHLNGELRRYGGDVVGLDPHAALVELTADGNDVIALGPDIPLDASLALAREVEARRPEISVVIVATPAPELWESALRAGVRDVIPTDARDDELRNALERAIQTSDRRRRNLTEADGG